MAAVGLHPCAMDLAIAHRGSGLLVWVLAMLRLSMTPGKAGLCWGSSGSSPGCQVLVTMCAPAIPNASLGLALSKPGVDSMGVGIGWWQSLGRSS